MKHDNASLWLFAVCVASVTLLGILYSLQTNNASRSATQEPEVNWAAGSTEQPTLKTPPSLTKAEESVLRAGFVSIDKSREIGYICLKRRLQKQQVIALLGERCLQDGQRISYSFAPSQWLDIYFDAASNVARVELTGSVLGLEKANEPNN